MTHATATIGRDSYATSIDVSSHHITADEPAKLGGRDSGPAPFDLLVASLGACTAITLRMYADRKGWPLERLKIELELSGTPDSRRIDRILDPVGLDPDQARRLAEIAERTPVTLALKAGLAIDTRLA